ncbi:hypothetical protein B0T18DRAFT_394284 [Schizothecium vesticola]|uniref:Uncharacterized protein n=1 Tax=Schizothecium vesticola TaxID=314040 RepID=A0AA40BPF8_9PEZI|nr:hypothetical protein B0T18DRAFT_394284 [Schizothecium vesticola]
MYFLLAAMVALASLTAGALALPGAVVADPTGLTLRDLIPLPDNTRFGCNPMEQDALHRDMVTTAMIVCIQSLHYGDITFAVCNYSPFGSQSCPESEILDARDILTQRCGLHAAWLTHDRPQGKTYTYDGYPTTVCNNMSLKMNMKVALNTTTTIKDGLVFNTITFASENDG